MKPTTLDSEIKKGHIRLGRGNIISSKDISRNPGDHPIYSSSAKGAGEFGRYGDYMFDEELITWSVDGGGRFFYRPKHKFSVTNVSGFMRVDAEVWNRRFVYYSLDLQHQKMAFDYQMKAHPSVIRHLYELVEFPKPEQSKIAEVLSTVDRAIEQTEALIAKQQRIKTGLMQDLLTRGIDEHGNLRSEDTHEFKDSPLGPTPVDWACDRLGLHLTMIEQGWSPDCDGDPAPVGSWGVLKTTAVVWDGYQDFENKLLPSGLEPRPRFEVQPKDVLMTRGGPNSRVGVVAYVKTTQQKLMLSDKLYRLRYKPSVHPEFLAMTLASSWTQRHLSTLKTGLAESQTNISQAIVKDLLIKVPLPGEQEQIASVMRELDRQLMKLRFCLTKLRAVKTALMQGLLTGDRRVTALLGSLEQAVGA